MNDMWSNKELEAAVKVYIDMRNKSLHGEKYKKKPYYEKLANEFGRTIKAYEYRMQNISYVYSLLGKEWIKGLRPAINVGSRVAGEIEEIINRLEGRTLLNRSEFEIQVNRSLKQNKIPVPKGNKEPKHMNSLMTQYIRDPQVVAWILKESKGLCECCNSNAPFLKEDSTCFLEVHHLKRLADKGTDTITNAIAVCPNCHRELHFGKNKELLIEKIFATNLRLIKE